ncbi:MAG: thioredoxin domain-containing protein [Deltaproteobacteria bacterium]|nr:thioredoxin domain-containing protein [Deltaproteobacteria bacterium]
MRRSAFSHLGPVSLPVLGLAFWVLFVGLSLGSARPDLRRARGYLGALAAPAGLTFLALQAFVVHAFCRYCVVVDGAAVVAGALAWTLRGAPGSVKVGAEAPYRESTHAAAWAPVGYVAQVATALGALLAAVVPLGYGFSVHPPAPAVTHLLEPPPPAILREQRDGVATIVEFVDFECPFCRRQQETLEPLLREYGPRVRLVRHNVPLSIHEHARDAARGQCCADEQGRGDRMAERLFHTEPDELTPAGCERIARAVGLDLDTWRACMTSQRPEASLERDHNLAREVGVSGLPTFWIGTERFEGYKDADEVRGSIERALRRASSQPRDAASAQSGT